MTTKSPISRFLRNKEASVSTMFALTMTVLMVTIGAGIDFGRVEQQKSIADGIADATVIAAVAAAVEADKAKKSGIAEIAKAAGLAAWEANAKASKFDIEGGPEIVITSPAAHEWTATATFDEQYSTHFMSLFGQDMFPVRAFAEATSSFGEVKEYWDVHIAVDDSASMGLGATQADMNKMIADKSIGCAFACHYATNGSDSMAIARNKGYKLRIDVVDEAIDAVTTKLESISDGSNVRMALHGINTTFREFVALSSNLRNVKNYKIDMGLTTNSKGNTNFRIGMAGLTSKVGTSGTGATSGSPKKAAIFITDGVHDHNINEINVVTRVSKDYYLGPISESFCQGLKNSGVKVGVLYVPYITPAGYGGYTNAYIANVPKKLKACASTDMYFEATQSSQIEGMLTSLINQAFGSDSDLRLTQ
ncbi:MAG: hypothetical protein GYA66_12670 [Phyllobacteriaceae bacterium]|nr:hypothetical protein [Phyllobacteriaceae bacterium]